MKNKMLYFVYPYDETTRFLARITDNIRQKFGNDCLQIIDVKATEESYNETLNAIAKIPAESVVIFMGHGQSDVLYGAEENLFPKRPLVRKPDVKVFSDKYLFCFSCNSNEFLKGTFRYSNIKESIGFGSLPTEMFEIQNNKRLVAQGVNEFVISQFREILIELVSNSFSELIKENLSFAQFSDYFVLLLNKKISQIILDNPENNEIRILADLLYQIRSEIVFI